MRIKFVEIGRHDVEKRIVDDGLVVARYLFGLRGSSLTTGAFVNGQGTRTGDVAVAQYLDNIMPLLDVDDDGRIDALSDGLMIVRYLFGLRGQALVQNAIGPGARRATAAAIEEYLGFLMK